MAKYVYLITEFATKYKGTAYYEKYKVPKGLSKDLIKKLFIELYKKYPNLLGLYYDPEKGELIVWLAKVKGYFLPYIIAGLAGIIGGILLWSKLTEKGEGQWNTTNPPGLGISLWDLVKLGLLAFIIYMFGKTFTDIFLAVKERKPMPSPYEVYVKPAIEVAKEVAPGVKYVAERYVAPAVKYVIRR